MSSRQRSHRHLWPETCFTVVVRLLEEDSSEEVEVPEDATGKWLFDYICKRQGITEEKEYFGLRYLERQILSSPSKQWLDLTRSILTQLKHTHPRVVSFRFKHYPAEPIADLRLPKTHYLLYRQLRRDLCSGRLVAQADEMIRLGALVMQVELGDSSMQDPPQLSAKNDTEMSYLSSFQVLHNQTPRMESLLLEEHKKLEGLLPSEAACEIIQLASSLETYGIDPTRVKTKAYGSRPVHLGLTHRGVAEFVSNRCQKLYPWSTISWMTCDGKHFVVAVAKSGSGKKKKVIETVNYKCETKAVARALWEWASDRQLFLTLEKSSTAKPIKSKGSIFSRTHTFKFSGRCRREVLGRPSLASTLPTNMSISEIDPSINMFANRTQPGNSHSISMVALTQESFTPECRLRTIGELDSPDEPKVLTGNGDISGIRPLETAISGNWLDTPAQNNTVGSMGRSQVSTLQSIASEPTQHPSNTPHGYVPLTQQQQTDNFEQCDSKHPKALGESEVAGRQVQADQLVPFFSEIPRRRYAPEAITKQRKLLKSLGRSAGSAHQHSDIFDTDDEEGELTSEAALAALQSAAEAGQAWAAESNGPEVKPESVTLSTGITSMFSWSQLFSASNSTPNHKATKDHETIAAAVDNPSTSTDYTVNNQESDAENGEIVPVSGWRLLALSAAFITGVSLVSLTVLLETEVHSPLTAAIRGHPWLLEFDARCYRPLRSAFFSLWRR